MLGVFLAEGEDEAEAAADHHVAVRRCEVWIEAAAAQLAALRARDGDQRACLTAPPIALRVEDAVALAVEDVLVRKRASEQAARKVLDLLAADLAGVVLVEADDLGAAQMKRERVHVAEIEHELFILRCDARILERADRSGRS